MFDFFKVSVYAFTGKLKNNPTLRKAYWAFLFVMALSIIALGYNAFMSLSFYQDRLGQLPFAGGISWAVTIGIALGVYFCMSFVAGFTLDLWKGRKEKTEHYLSLFIFCCLVLLGAVSWDVYANLEGVDPVSRHSTNLYAENQAESIRIQYDNSIAAENQKIAAIKQKYYWKGKLYFEPYPVTRHPKSVYKKDVDAIEKIQSRIQELQELQKVEINSAMDDYQRGKSLYDQSVSSKQVSHRTIVKGIYIVVLLIAFMSNAYMDAVIEHVERDLKSSSKYATSNPLLSDYVPAPLASNGKSLNPATDSRMPIGFHQEDDTSKSAKQLTVSPKIITVRETETVAKKGYKIICNSCGKTAIKNSPNRAKYCSKECRKAAYRNRTGKALGV